jgi:hypothetical protein
LGPNTPGVKAQEPPAHHGGRPPKKPNQVSTQVGPAVDAGWPQKESNRVATQVVPTIYPNAMHEVCNRERGQDNLNFVPRSLAQPKPEKIPQGTHTLLISPNLLLRSTRSGQS